MITATMQHKIERMLKAGSIAPGQQYRILPSDCEGNGYDIALKSRPDESGDYLVDGVLMRVTCSVRVGSSNWHEGTPAGYRLECAPSAPYTLQIGERAIVRHRKGRTIGQYMYRALASIAIQREDGSLVYRGRTPYWIASTHTYASHWRSGMSRRDKAAYDAEVAQLEAIAKQINATKELKEVLYG